METVLKTKPPTKEEEPNLFILYYLLVPDRTFQQYDLGWLGNWRKYGQLRPPSYRLSNVKVPVALFYSNNDWLAPGEVRTNGSEV